MSLTQDLASSASDQSLSFSYNRSGQALTRTGSNAAYVWPQPSPSTTNATANGLNQLATLNGAGVSHDGRGNLTAAGAAAYGYDIFNRLTSAGTATLGYDPAGRLYETAGGGVTTRFLYDGADAIAEYNASGALLRRYVHGPGVDEPIVWYEGSGTTDRRWLHADRLGSVIAVSDASGAALAINAYDEYGAPGSSNAGRFQYTGQMWLPEAGLYHYKARAYAPSLGRFLQSDPILHAGGMNLYAYVGGDPVNARDPSGLCPPCLLPFVVPAIAGGVTAYGQYLDELHDGVPGINGWSVGAAFLAGTGSAALTEVNPWWGGAAALATVGALDDFNQRQIQQNTLSPSFDDRPNGRPYRNPEGPIVSSLPSAYGFATYLGWGTPPLGASVRYFDDGSWEAYESDGEDFIITASRIPRWVQYGFLGPGYGELNSPYALIAGGMGAAIIGYLSRSNEQRLRERADPELMSNETMATSMR